MVMETRLSRWLRHRWADDAVGQLPSGFGERIADMIRNSERSHTAEICFYVESSLPSSTLWQRCEMQGLLKQRAQQLFATQRIWDTEHNNGVLLYICLAEHAVEIVFDRALVGMQEPQFWDSLAQEVAAQWKATNLERGLTTFVDKITPKLAAQFPIEPGKINANELSDSPHLG
ncbi:TPM domain-containing protein [Rhodoferax sp.]|uniref:TPM domain-containing protein n=1 Tax=Rhodoferax sp. TaxID=50421 RepID=UPI00344D5E17